MRSQFILSPGIGVHEPRRFCADRGGGTAHFNATSNRLSSVADFSPRGICFSSAARKCGCPILSLGKGGTKSPPLYSFVIPRGLQSAGDLLFLRAATMWVAHRVSPRFSLEKDYRCPNQSPK